VTLTCKFKRLHESARMPTKAHPSDAGFDLHALAVQRIGPGETVLIPTGIAIELPPGWCASVRPRSSLNRIGVIGGMGLIDPGYRGSIGVTLTNLHEFQYFTVKEGDRVAQLVIEQLPVVEMVEVDELSASDRNTNGFGSSGR
jgi:dUTP pyrophosphatase